MLAPETSSKELKEYTYAISSWVEAQHTKWLDFLQTRPLERWSRTDGWHGLRRGVTNLVVKMSLSMWGIVGSINELPNSGEGRSAVHSCLRTSFQRLLNLEGIGTIFGAIIVGKSIQKTEVFGTNIWR